MVAQLAVVSVWGIAADRMGKKPVLALASLGLVPVGLGWIAMTEHRVWLGYLLSGLGGALWAGVEIANLNLVLELSSGEDGQEPDSSFIAVNSVIINVAGFLGGIASGWIAQRLAHLHWQPIAAFKAFTFYDVLFALSGILRLLAVVVFLPHLKEPTARPAREALQFMSGNIYNNLFNAILQPLRMARIAANWKARDKQPPG
jgi:MFS family permease